MWSSTPHKRLGGKKTEKKRRNLAVGVGVVGVGTEDPEKLPNKIEEGEGVGVED